ncbi:uncharacterized protein LOC131243555 [Magnolia sinica]|uniref:uncharacterized protein LOC131243555 n=1 Tax=Magnolia sinica TaxID=86752 RepID=UPI002657BDAB|nr:uncharacterized protein LOC131243555 [Magnolia sinica]
MARFLPTSLQISHPFSSSPQNPKKLQKSQHNPFPNKALEPQNEPASSDPAPELADSDSEFDSRLAQVRLKYRSGTGKKAELRKSKKSPSSSKKGVSVFLPPVPLKEPVSGGLKVDFGFCPYTERLNGRLAALGLAALLLVELASGKSVLSYHKPPILFVQIYFMAAVSAVFVKYEKEKVSVWPDSIAKK